MAPGPPDKLSNNRYYLLGDFIENPPKRKKGSDFPELVTINGNNHNTPKYILITSTDAGKQISKLSPFAIKKGLENISTEFNSISLLRDGSLLVLASNTRAAEKFLKSKSLGSMCPIICKYHETLNSVKGVIFAPCLIHVQESEIIQEMKDQGVTDVYKFTKPTEDGKSRIPSGKMILTFDLYRLPSTVNVAWYKCKVDHYIPNPMRCKNCQLLGHTKNRCKGNTTCPDCSLPPHAPEKCTRIFCINCSGDHSSADNKCPRFIQMKEILTIKTKNYCTLAEARRKFRENNPVQSATHNSYAAITSGISANFKESSRSSTTKLTSTTQTKKSAEQPTTTQNLSIVYSNKTDITPTNSTKEHNTKITSLNLPSEISNITSISPTTQLNNNHMDTDPDISTPCEGKPPSTSYLQKSKITTKTTTTNINNKYDNSNPDTRINSDIPLSPFSQITQSLMKNNDYFVTLSDDESLNEFNTKQKTT